MEELLCILQEIRPDIDFKSEKALMSQGLLDSFDVVSIISELNDAYNISIRVHDLVPENFDSVEAIMNMINRLKQPN
jgi:acyl carrier protein